MNALLRSLPISVTLSTLVLSVGLAQATGVTDGTRLRGGTLVCGGNHFSRLSGSEQHRTSYVFRNFGASSAIVIDRVQLFDANGISLFDFPDVDTALPTSVKTELGPHETTQLNSSDILYADLGPVQRPIQTVVEWSYGSGQKGPALTGSAVRTIRADTGQERSRASSECKLIHYRR